MDWQIRIAIFIAAISLVGYIYWDFAKKKKIHKANEKLKRQYGDLSSQVDASGFDVSGVGQARAAGVEPNSTGESIKAFISNRSSEQQSEPSDLFENDATEVKVQQEPQLVFSLILQAKANTQYAGKDFLPIFLSQGLRHGEMDIFHRHQKTGSDPGPALFSLANAIAPGTFSLDALDSFHTPALILFMTLPGVGDAQIAYNAMVKTARLIVTELGGVVLDESQSVYSEQTHNHRLDQIQEHNRKTIL